MKAFVAGTTALPAPLAARSAEAGRLYFTPAGSQLDGDAILDIALSPGSQITFTIGLNTSEVSADPATYTRFVVEYNIAWDTSELVEMAVPTPPNSGHYESLITNFALDGMWIDGGRTITFLAFPGLWPHDGLADFTGSLVQINAFNPTTLATLDVTSQFSSEDQIVEVQTVPEIDPATGGSAFSLVAGVLAMIEHRRRRGAVSTTLAA